MDKLLNNFFNFTNALEISSNIFCIDKPLGLSSFMLVDIFKKLIGTKVGHAGTLDPLATGALILLTGNATKRTVEYLNDDKIYDFTVVIGLSSNSYDLETSFYDVDGFNNSFTKAQIQDLKNSVLGEHLFPVGVYSALKNQGKPLYKDKTQDTTKLKTMIVKDIAVLSQNNLSTDDLIYKIESKLNTIEQNYNYVKSELQYYLGTKHVTLYNNLTNNLRNNIDTLNQYKSLSFLELKVKAKVSKGTYVRILVEQMAKQLDLPMTTFDINRLCKYN